MNALLQDLRYAVRLLLKNPGFALAAIVTLALGIGANTAIFSLIHSVLLRPLAYPEPDRLVRIWTNAPQQGRDMEQAAISLPRFEAIRDASQEVFAEIGVSSGTSLTLTGRGEEATQVDAAYVSERLFQTLGLQPLHGRAFLPEEDRPGGPKVVLISHPFWKKHFGGDPALTGQSITLDGAPHTVIGILPPRLSFPFDRANMFIPRVFENPGITPAQLRQGTGFIVCTARLRPGVTLARANEAVQVIAGRYRQAFPGNVDASFGIKVIPFQEEIVGESRPAFYALAGAVGCVLLIACVNVANLLLARLARRRKEIAIRSALGADRKRLVQQFLTESVLLTTLAGGLGVLLALWCVDAIRGLGPEFIPRASEVRVDPVTLGFTLAVSLATGILLGLVPAWQAARGDVGEALQDASRGASGGVRQSRARGALLVAQVALSLVLLVGAGLLLTSLWRLQQVRLGFNPEGVLTAQLMLPAARYPEREKQADFFLRLTERLQAIPGVRRAATAIGAPLTDNGGTMFYAVIGRPLPPVKERPAAKYCVVSPDYFSTLEIPVLRGRAFTERDRGGTPPVMVINETMARRLFPDGNALGQRILCSVSDPTETEVVGVVGDVRSRRVAEPAREEMYFSLIQRPDVYMTVLVRAANPAGAEALAPSLRAAVRALDSDQPVAGIEPMKMLVSRSVADRRLTALLLAGFAGLALVLAAIGIYGVMAYAVAQRTREIGIRLALGAQRSDVFRLIVGGGMRLAGLGLVLGALAALGLTRLLSGLLFNVGANDPLTFSGVIGLLAAVALVANYLPARRAMRVNPTIALREE